jgi:methionyl-tRNA formyltransferase
MARRMPKPLALLLVAEESAGIQTLRHLVRTEHRLVAVLARRPPTDTGAATVATVAAQLGLPVWDAGLVARAEVAGTIREAGVDLLLNVHSLFVAHGDVVAAPRVGSFNLHPGPLPDYAGLNAPSWAIYNGEISHGVTLHRMERDVDTGAIAYAAPVPIRDNDTGLSLSAACVRHGLPLIRRLVDTAARDPAAIPAVAQDLARRRWYGKAPPQDGRVAWAVPARRVRDFVRAADYGPFPSPWGRPRTRAGDEDVGVCAAALTGEPCDAPPGTVRAAAEDAVAVATADEWLLVRRAEVGGEVVDAARVLAPGTRLR